MIENTTECYIERDGKLLLMHRTKMEGDLNKDKWIGVGGHVEGGETPEECIRREMREETGLTADRLDFRGIVTFVCKDLTEYMFMFTAREPRDETGRAVAEGTALPDCDEGELAWVAWDDVFSLPIWEGDKIFLKLLREGAPFFSLKLVYDDDNALREAVLNERALPLP